MELSENKLYALLIAPRAGRDDVEGRRREFILNVVLVALLCTGIFLDLTIAWAELTLRYDYDGISFGWFSLVVGLWAALLALSRMGYRSAAARITVAANFAVVMYAAGRWGVDLPAVMLGYGFLVVLGSVLLSTRFAAGTAAFLAAFVAGLGYMQIAGIVPVQQNWRARNFELYDLSIFVCILLSLLTLSWLSNREIEKSLRRAQLSEELLTRERDELEDTVARRTEDLKRLQAEQVAQLSAFAEFGKLASGIFHDLVNPMTSVSLQVGLLRDSPGANPAAKRQIERLYESGKRMEHFVVAARKQLQRQDTSEAFAIVDEIKDVIMVLRHKALLADVAVDFIYRRRVETVGNQLKFHQAMLNVISNAIDAYGPADEGPAKKRRVLIDFVADAGHATITVHDDGCGIPADDLDRIFQPFFSTKSRERGIGIGLSTARTAVEDGLGGTLSAISSADDGTSFVLRFPIVAPKPWPVPEPESEKV